MFIFVCNHYIFTLYDFEIISCEDIKLKFKLPRYIQTIYLFSQEDLKCLTVVNTLHLLSIKRAIQVLRQNDFNPLVLRRRPIPDEVSLFSRSSVLTEGGLTLEYG